jgi:hypothetical protein
VKPIALEERFWPKVTLAPAMDCWEWRAYRDQHNYGRISVGGRGGTMDMAHRVAWRLLRGDIPDGLHLDHLCRNPPCVNPWHLDPVTPQINSRRGIAGEVNGARQRGVTHCPKGHAYDDSNTQVRPTGARRCRACAREYARVYRRRLA